MLIKVVSILLVALLTDWLSKKEEPPERLIRDRLTFTNSRLMLRESFRPVTEVGSSSTFPRSRKETFSSSVILLNLQFRNPCHTQIMFIKANKTLFRTQGSRSRGQHSNSWFLFSSSIGVEHIKGEVRHAGSKAQAWRAAAGSCKIWLTAAVPRPAQRAAEARRWTWGQKTRFLKHFQTWNNA